MSGMLIPVVHGAALDRPDEADTLWSAECVSAALRRLGHRAEIVHVGPDLAALGRVRDMAPDTVLNLVEAIGGDAARGAEFPAELDRLGLSYTGCNARASLACLSKPEMKRAMDAAGIPTPAWSTDGAGLAPEARVIVKAATEHASVGLDAGSVVAGRDAAREIAERTRRFGTEFFAEAYIDGREFNISALDGPDGPQVLPVAEIDFVGYGDDRPRIVDYDAKWTEGTHGYENTPRRFAFAEGDRDLIEQLTALTLRVWELFGLTGFARVDFRVDAEGRPWVLEANTNPCLAPDAGFVAAAAEAGLGYDTLVGRIAGVSRQAGRCAA